MNLQIYPWQTSQWDRLAAAFNKDRIPHALLLAGQDGLGLEHFASCLAAKWLCAAPLTDGACGSCRSCVLFLAGNHPDIARLEPEEAGKQIKVDAIRDVISFFQLRSQYGLGKIAVITPAEAMNRSAANSLLKILEEPPAGSVFILISHQAALLPVTIRSRCQRLDFATSYAESSLQWLATNISAEGVSAADLLTLSGGRPLQAMAMMENDTLTRQGLVLADLGRLHKGTSDITATAQRWHDIGATSVFEWLQTFLANMTRMKVTGTLQQQAFSTLNKDLQQMADRLELNALLQAYDLALNHYRAIMGPYNLNQMGLLEQFIVYWQSMKITKGGTQ